MAVTNQTPGGTQVRTPPPKPAPQTNVNMTISHKGSSSVQEATGHIMNAASKTANTSKTSTPKAPAKTSTPKAPAKPATTPAAPSVYSPINAQGQFVFQSPQQIAAAAQATIKGQAQAALDPLQAAANQINQSQTGALQAYGRNTAGVVSDIGNLRSQAAAGALTQSNAAAQAAVDAANRIDASGKAAAALGNGYLGPASQQALQNQRTFTGTTQGAEAAYLPNVAASNTGLLAAMQGAAGMRGLEGAAAIRNTFEGRLATNQGQQQAIIAAEPGKAATLANTLGQQQFQDWALARQIGIKAAAQQTAQQVAQANIKINLGKLALGWKNSDTAAYRAQVQAGYDKALTNLGWFKANDQASYHAADIATRKYVSDTNAAIHAAEIAAGNKRLSETTRHDKAMEAAALRKQVSNPTQLKGMAEMGAAANVYKALTTVPSAHRQIDPATKKTVTVNRVDTPTEAHAALMTSPRFTGVIGEAAFQLAYWGYINTATANQLKLQGVTPQSQWLVQPGNSGPPYRAGLGISGAPPPGRNPLGSSPFAK